MLLKLFREKASNMNIMFKSTLVTGGKSIVFVSKHYLNHEILRI